MTVEREAILQTVQRELALATGLSEKDIDNDRSFEDYDLDSLDFIEMCMGLDEAHGGGLDDLPHQEYYAMTANTLVDAALIHLNKQTN